MKNKSSVPAVLGLLLISFSMVLVGGLPRANAATTITVNSSWCSGAGFSWNAGTLTCTLTAPVTIPAGDDLAIPSATTLTVASTGSLGFAAGFVITLVSVSTVTIEDAVLSGSLSIDQGSACGTDTVAGSGGGTFGAGTTLTSATACTTAGVPEFPPISALSPLVIIALLFPVLMIMRRQFNRPPI